MRLVKFLLLSLIFVLSGCTATFIEKSISPPQQFSAEQYKNKPNAYIQVKWINGNPNKFITSDPRWDEGTKNRMSYLLNKTQLFNYYTFDKDQVENDAIIFNRDRTDQANQHKKEIDYTLELVIYNNYDKVWTDWVPITQLFSLGLVPVYYTNEYIVTLKVYDKQGSLVKSGQNSILAKSWVSWWVLPLSFQNAQSDVGYLINNQIETLLKECVDQNIFKYH